MAMNDSVSIIGNKFFINISEDSDEPKLLTIGQTDDSDKEIILSFDEARTLAHVLLFVVDASLDITCHACYTQKMQNNPEE
jgi:hypothetical protein